MSVDAGKDRERAIMAIRRAEQMAGKPIYPSTYDALADVMLEFAAEQVDVFNQYPTKDHACKLRAQKRSETGGGI